MLLPVRRLPIAVIAWQAVTSWIRRRNKGRNACINIGAIGIRISYTILSIWARLAIAITNCSLCLVVETR